MSLLAELPDHPRIAVLRASRIGDYLCATPALRALRAARPDADITLIALPLVRDLAERLPYIDRFLPFPGFTGMADQFFDARRTLRFLATRQSEHFDLAIQMHGSGATSNPFALLRGAKKTAGFIAPGGLPGLLDLAVPLPEHGHEIDRALVLTTALGAPPCGYQPEAPLLPADRAAAAHLLTGIKHPLIGLHPGTWDTAKRWPLERFAALSLIFDHDRDGRAVWIGGDAEHGGIVAPTRDGDLDLIGRTSLAVAAAVIERLDLLITTDSGPAHLAYALGTPSVTLFGDTDPRQWGPRAGPHAVVANWPMNAIGVDQVVRAARAVLTFG